MNEKKAATVEKLQAELTGSDFLVFFSFTGISGQDITRFRKDLKQQGGNLKVAKNTLLDIALERSGLAECRQMVQGPTGFIFYRGEDEIAVLKAISAFTREKKDLLVIRGGNQGETVFSPEQLAAAARLPGREQVIALFCGALAAPLASFLFTLKAVPWKFTAVISQIAEQGKSAS